MQIDENLLTFSTEALAVGLAGAVAAEGDGGIGCMMLASGLAGFFDLFAYMWMVRDGPSSTFLPSL